MKLVPNEPDAPTLLRAAQDAYILILREPPQWRAPADYQRVLAQLRDAIADALGQDSEEIQTQAEVAAAALGIVETHS